MSRGAGGETDECRRARPRSRILMTGCRTKIKLRLFAPEDQVETEPAGDDGGPGVRVIILAHHGRRLLPSLVDLANRKSQPISGIRVQEPNLESVFLSLTGRALRE